MPLRDHFRPPVWNIASPDAVYALWLWAVIQELNKFLPDCYSAAPRIGSPQAPDADVPIYLGDSDSQPYSESDNGLPGCVPPLPTHTTEAELPYGNSYEVRIYDNRGGRRIVAMIALISPTNKDRPESRGAFVSKVNTLLKEHVCVSIVDIVTTTPSNLYVDLMTFAGRVDPNTEKGPSHLYATTIRHRIVKQRDFVDSWHYPFEIGNQLPTLPIWLAKDQCVPLELEASYETACRSFGIR